MRKLIDRASEVQRRYGVRGLLREVVDRAVLRTASVHLVHVMQLDPDAVRSPVVDRDVELRFLDPDEVARFAEDPTNRIGAEFVDRARRGRDLCFGAFCDGRLASYGWYALGSVEGEHAAGAALSLPPDTAYLYKGFTHPDFRGRALYPACIEGAFSALRARGIERLLAFVSWSNEAALRSSRGLGFESLGRLVVGPRGPLRIPAAARALGVGFGVDATETAPDPFS